MNVITLPGIDGREPLGFFAGLGILRIIETIDPEVRLGWKEAGARWIAELARQRPDIDIDSVATTLAEALKILASNHANGITLGYDTIDIPHEVFSTTLADAVARWTTTTGGDANQTERPWRIQTRIAPALLGAFANEAARSSSKSLANATRTPLSFSNGQSGRNLLKDFRTAAGLSTPSRIRDTLYGTATGHQVPSLNWHHTDYRPAAYRWDDPGLDKPKSDPGINALAFVGLSFLPVIPTPEARVPGFESQGRKRTFSWPLWSPLLTLDRIASLLAQEEWYRMTPNTGICAVRACELIRSGPRGERTYFARSRAVG